ncbi:MAG: AMP-binding protein [Comamonadaceae bacterium]|nr:AMP-binding protein [Comamonadaceae bacterium]
MTTPRQAPGRASALSFETLPQMLRSRIQATPDGRGLPRTRRPGVDELQLAAVRRRASTASPRRWTSPRRLARARIALLLPNGLDAVTLDQAALARGCVPLPMHALDNPLSIAYILADSGAELLVVQTEAQWRAIADCAPLPATLREVVIREPDGQTPPTGGGPAPLSLADWLARGDAAPRRPRTIGPAADDLAALVYTSGTDRQAQGRDADPRQRRLRTCRRCWRGVAPGPDDVFLSFLPLSHTFERTAGYYLPIAAGAAVAFARSTRHLPEDLQAVRPTVLISVPRIYERVYAKLRTMLDGFRRRSGGSSTWRLRSAGGASAARSGCGAGAVPAALETRWLWPLLARSRRRAAAGAVRRPAARGRQRRRGAVGADRALLPRARAARSSRATA